MQQLLDFYSAFSASLGVSYDENGMGCITTSGKKTPVTLENKRLVLPTSAHLKASNWESVVAFHPLCESVVRGESEVFGFIRERVLRKINTAALILISELTMLASDADGMANLTDNQMKILASLGKLDARSAEDLAEIYRKSAAKGNGSLINIYVRRDDKVGDKRFRRVAVTSFPLLDALDKTTVHGVQLRQADRRFLRSLLTCILPNCDIEDQYSKGSNADIAPYFDVLVNSYKAVMDPLNSMLWTFKGPIGKVSEIRSPTDWWDKYAGAIKESNLIPALPHNIGIGGDGVAVPTHQVPSGIVAAPQGPTAKPGTLEYLLQSGQPARPPMPSPAYGQPSGGYPAPQMSVAQLMAAQMQPQPQYPHAGMPQQHGNPLANYATVNANRGGPVPPQMPSGRFTF